MKFRCLVLFALAIAGAIFFIVQININRSAGSHILEIRDSITGRTYGSWLLEEGEEFAMEFIHSVNQTPVRETFTIQDGMICLTALRFYSYGAGIPGDLEEGQIMTRDGDAFIITGFSTSFKELKLIIGTYSDHLLIIKNEIISLRDVTGLNSNTGGRNANITIQLR